jgi:carboxymethylenebutenolidase
MCTNDECSGQFVKRRRFLATVTVGLASIALRSEAADPQPPSARALHDPSVVQGTLSFRSGAATLQGYQARPQAAGRHWPVLVLHGDFGLPEAYSGTAAQLAQAGFVSLAIKRFARYPELTLEDVIRSDRTDRRFLTRTFNEEELADAQAAIDHLHSEPFVKPAGVGVVGFCGGGYHGLWLSTRSKDIKAIVILHVGFIANNAPQDPKPSMMELVKQVRVPVQGHFGTADASAPVEAVRQFEQALKAQGTPIEIFFYEGARHGFCDYTRTNYDPVAASLAHRRTIPFLERYLSGSEDGHH